MPGRPTLVLVALAVLVAGVRFHRSPRDAGELRIVPDSVEYAVGAQRFATLGRCDLEIEGVAYPLRYPPWFSLVALSPAYAIAPDEIGAGIVPVLLFALLGIAAAWSIGDRLAGPWGGAGAAALLASEVTYGAFAREIMTDVPAAALALCACRLYLALRDEERGALSWWLAGLLVASAAALRSEAGALALPFLLLAVRRPGRGRAILGLVALPALLLVATAIYQQATFGDWRRNGYLFWCPVPLDYPELTFAKEHVAANLRIFTQPWILPTAIFGALGTVVLLARRSSPARGLLLFAALGALPGSLLHVVFFFSERRFHLPLVALLSAIGGAGVVSLVPDAVRARWKYAAAILALVPLALPRPYDKPSNRRELAAMMARATPEDAVIVTRVEPVYLEPLVVRGTRRRIVPVSRNVEYASKAVAWRRIPTLDPPARGPWDHRAPGLFRGGARDVVEFTADERPDQLADWALAGVPVFVDEFFLPKKFPIDRLREFGVVLEEVEGEPGLSRLVSIR